jgi:hydrogenase maturation protease HycI
LENLSQAVRNPDNRIAFIGIGSELHGDDGAGIEIIRSLSRRAGAISRLAFIEGGMLPESTTGPIRRFAPNLVIVFDAADFRGVPGEVHWLDPHEIGGYSASTHTFPLGAFADYLRKEFACEVQLLGIQPKAIEFGTILSPEVKKACQQLAYIISQFINRAELENQGP